MSNYTPLYELASSLIPQGSKVTEWGCGNGVFLNFLKEKDLKNYYGLDINEHAIRLAKQDHGYWSKNFICADITDPELEWFPRTYVALEVLEHLPLMEDLALLERVAKGSRVIISVPSFSSDDHKIFFPEEWSAISHYCDVINIDLWRKISLPTGGGYFHLLRGYR